MRCPYCNTEYIHILPRAYINADSNDNLTLTKTECCGKLVTIKSVRVYAIKRYIGNRKKDDWGE